MDVEQRSPSEQQPSPLSSVAQWAQRCAERRLPEQARTWVVNSSTSPSDSAGSEAPSLRAFAGRASASGSDAKMDAQVDAQTTQMGLTAKLGALSEQAVTASGRTERSNSSGHPIVLGKAAGSEPIALAQPSLRLEEPSAMSELSLSAIQARNIHSLEVQGPFAAGLALGARSIGSSGAVGEASLSIRAEQSVLDAIELTERNGRCVVRFASNVAWKGEPPLLVGVLPKMQELSLGDEVKAGVGVFAAPELRIALADRARAQVSAPDGGRLRELSARCEGESQLWISTPNSIPWSIEEGLVSTAGQARVNLSGAAFVHLDVRARDMSKVQAIQAQKMDSESGAHAVIDRREAPISMPLRSNDAPVPRKTLTPA